MLGISKSGGRKGCFGRRFKVHIPAFSKKVTSDLQALAMRTADNNGARLILANDPDGKRSVSSSSRS